MKLTAKTIALRLVEVSDAAFILKLRIDSRINQFLSQTAPDLEAQKDWIRKYKSDEARKAQFYFIIERLDGTPIGTVRVYDFIANSFCWGSWILNEDKTRYAALESAFLVYEFGFEKMGFEKSHFDVRRENKKVISFHEKMGAMKVSEDQINCYFEITQQAVNVVRKKMAGKLL